MCIHVCVVSVLMYYCMYLYLYFVLFFILKIQPTNILLLLIIQYANEWTYKQTDRRTDGHEYMRQRHFQSTYIQHVSISVRFQVTTTRTLRDIHVSINKMKTFSRTLGSIYHNCLFYLFTKWNAG